MSWSVPQGRHPGWPARLGPLRVPAGVVEVRAPKLFDATAWSRVRRRDRLHLESWEPTVPGNWNDNNATLAWPGQWSTLRGLGRRGMSLPFVILVDGEFAGQVTVGNVVRGALCSAWIGYWVGTHATAGGVATAAVALVVDHCFGAAGLHRLEATVRPENQPSLRVLGKLGFREEGVFRRYLDVAGGWRDHVCFALTTEDVPNGLVAGLVAGGRAELV
ncbi:GNAT family N-acetyltransferase [Actinophytocola gossypii]|uniref:GNAT family N-acetyltransferase n=1 Tax=Actinophytocola gossypii TaxID=2812003 RepID=A0ABT2J5U5_9PSEU|nr:GNAT family protein [Actinophytocola gossypii]MCT2582964.1 GNAT family N-acetyltransferase [Actinophytocola gossypii]